ncbi:MAG: GlsB/YeaQ/YmgE family stress response membrane protein [Saprospiraceae bacterium]|nr:GlsB/YeaQ/YmgE family stress response membrane protein [Saprospiraceae bacterium]|tara:strand:+ start:77 stop:340 length:264 start_codon:yes stop_codon:yes gene_type:complete
MGLQRIIIWLILGAISGWIAGQLMKGRGFGLVGNIVVGILGSFIGGWLGGKLGIYEATVGGLSLPSILTSVGGAVVLLFIIGLVKKS